MSAPPFMKLYWGDYFRDTRHLTREEHGAYFLLLGEAWNHGGFLPDDDDMLARWALATPEEWARLKPVVMALFKPAKGRWRHKRIAEELATYEEVSRKRKSAGRKGGSVSRGKGSGNSEASAEHPLSESRHNQNQNQNQNQKDSSEPSERTQPQQSDAGASSGKASRLPPNWEPGPHLREYAQAEGFDGRDLHRLIDDFRDYWVAQPGGKGTKLDWPATFRRWVRTAAERRDRNKPKPQGRQSWT